MVTMTTTHKPLTRQQRMEYRAKMIGEDAKNAMKFERKARRIFGHGPTAVILRQLVFLEGQQADPKGGIYKTYRDWQKEESLSRSSVDTARKNLEGVVRVKTRGVHNKMYWYVDFRALYEKMLPELDPPDDPSPENSLPKTPVPTLPKHDKLLCEEPTKYLAGNPQTHNRENVREDHRDSFSTSTENNSVDVLKEKETQEKNHANEAQEDQPDASANSPAVRGLPPVPAGYALAGDNRTVGHEVTSFIRNALFERYGDELMPGYCDAYVQQINSFVLKGRSKEDVLATVEKIIEMNPCRKWITVEQAYQQVQLDRSRVREDGVP